MSKKIESRYVALTRFKNMSQNERLKAWSIQNIDKWKAKIITGKYSGLVDFSAIALTEEYYAGLKSDAYLHVFRRWPNGSEQWLPKSDADLIMKSVPNYKKRA